jgi:hypothetical protein
LARPADVRVGFYASRDHDLAGAVNYSRSIGRNGSWLSDGDNLLSFDCDIQVSDSSRGDHLSALDDQIYHN